MPQMVETPPDGDESTVPKRLHRLFLQTKSSFINAILNLQLDSSFVPETRKQWYQTNIFSVKKMIIFHGVIS